MPQINEKLSGVFAPVVTPFTNDEPDYDHLSFNLQKLNNSALKGYLALGSNGEFMSLSEREQIKVLEVFAKNKGDKVVMVGTGCESTQQTIDKSKMAANMGFDYVSILTPHYFAKRMDGATLKDYYTRVADSVDIPVLLYNAPGFTGGVMIPAQTVADLAKHPNIIGMKDSAPTGPAKFLTYLDQNENFTVLAGSASFLYPSLHLGADGGVISLANFIPQACCELFTLFQQGKFERAKDLHSKLSRLNNTISGTWGVAGVKAAMNIMGFKGGLPRHPLKEIHEDGVKKIHRALSDEGYNPVE